MREFLIFDARGIYDTDEAVLLGTVKAETIEKAFHKARKQHQTSFALYEGEYLVAWKDGGNQWIGDES